MQGKTFTPILFTGLLFFSLACTDDQSGQTNAPSSEEHGIDHDSLLGYQIDSTDAMSYIDAYDTYIDSVNATIKECKPEFNTDKKLIYGVSIDLNELVAVLHHAKLLDPYSVKKDSLYGMLAIMPGDSAELVFVLETKNSTKFFDFTMPCPNACPEFLKVD